MKVFIIGGSNWRGLAYFSASLDTIFISDRAPQSDHEQLIKSVLQANNKTIWR